MMMMHSQRQQYRRRLACIVMRLDVTYRLILFCHSMKRRERERKKDEMTMKTKDMLSNNHSSLHFYFQEHNEIFFQDKKYPWTFAISRKNMSNILLSLSCLLFKLSHHIIISKSMMMILLIDDNSN